MRSLKSVFRLVGAILALLGAALVVLGFFDELRDCVRSIAACRARREEMKDYVD